MTKKRSKAKIKLINQLGFKEDRAFKLLGAFIMFLALYLFIAFFSYLFTWQTDQDTVLHFSWQTLFASDIEVSNWLGRLGAVLSNGFFYWGFGVSSFLFIVIFTLIGIRLIDKTAFPKLLTWFYHLAFGIVFIALVADFVFRSSGFPWGGAFGQQVNTWLLSFVGMIGLVLLLIFVGTSYLLQFYFHLIPESIKYRIRSFFKVSEDVTIDDNSDNPDVIKPVSISPEISEIVSLGDQFNLDLEPEVKEGKKKTKEPGFELPEHSKIGQNGAKAEPEILNEPPKEDEIKINEEEEDPSEPYDPKKDLSTFTFPEMEVLNYYEDPELEIDRDELVSNKDQIVRTLLNYKIEITYIKVTVGPTVTLYEIVPAPGVRISKIKNLEDDIALSLAALGIRIIAPMPGKGTIGIEVPNKKKQVVSLRTVLKSEKFLNSKMDLPIALGKTISDEVFVADLAKMPHLLVAGATGQGKSVGINSILVSLLYKKHPSEMKLVLIDPKKVELPVYTDIAKHYLAAIPGHDDPIITDTAKVINTLNSLCIEMDSRYDLLKKARVRNLKEYNVKFINRKLNPQNGHYYLPYIVLVIDEFADLIMTAGKEIEQPIARLAQLARAVGIHLVIATQRPSVNIITGIIKANFPARIAFKVSSKIDSRTILDAGGAEQLIGRGDMLLSAGGKIHRLQCAFVDTPEVEKVVSHITAQQGYPDVYELPEFESDADRGGIANFSELDSLFEDAARLVVTQQHGSTSMIQRRMKLGYNRAGRIMDQLEALGIVGPSEGSKAREVLVFSEMELDRILEEFSQQA
jgi:S-DNA-T family DNA segregation ATPase FtsK/SpoIIIE